MKAKLWLVMLLVSVTAGAQDENLKMRFDFENVSGTSVTDGISGITATMVSSANVTTMGRYHVLDLGSSNGYLDITSDAGEIFVSYDTYTISAFYRVENSVSLSGNGYFLWSFSTQAANGASDGIYTAYRLNAQRIASSTGGYTNETGGQVGIASPKGQWMHVAYTQSGTTGKLYINGALVSTVESMPENSTLYPSVKPVYCWIGRAPFAGDNYLRNTLVYDFRLYNRELSVAELTVMARTTALLDNAYTHASQGNNTSLLSAISTANTILSNEVNYLPDAISELRAAKDMATEVAGGYYSQDYMDETENMLNGVIAAVEATESLILPTITRLIESYDTERGFIHPGGLHTQVDFNRVKAQLAAGNETVMAAYNILRNAAYAQPDVATWPVETIVRGGGVGENYINAARGATMAYQNALRWKIEDNENCAAAAVRILMQWANTTKNISGDSNYALAAGIYGYQFAQAAELVRDYEGWSSDDFLKFKQWMLSVWYPKSIGFLRNRNGSWENVGAWWRAPGHYWSNWGLCNALCIISIGILCDDVFIYNQGMSYYKYDQVGTFVNPRVDNPILGDGLNEFLGNLVVTTSESALETGAYGQLGQMQESGRDTGHPAMALGLAVDIAKVGWNQGDDLFSYMNHRLAAGIEYVAAQTQSIGGLPWTDFHYYSKGYAYTDPRSEIHMGPCMPVEIRRYWGNVIGVYEGIKGVTMPFSETSYTNMGIDGGGETIGHSSGYDHLGYTVLMNTYVPQLAETSQVPTELSPKMQYSGSWEPLIPSKSVEETLGNIDGNIIAHNELGGLINNYFINNNTCVPTDESITLMPQLPDGEPDTGNWLWNTGETTRNITVPTNKSFVYRVTYTNANGIKSQQCFPIAVTGDGVPDRLKAIITYNGISTETDTQTVLYGTTVTLHAQADRGWGTYQWSTGETTEVITSRLITSDRDYTAYFKNQSGTYSSQTFHIHVTPALPYIIADNAVLNQAEKVVLQGTTTTLGIEIPDIINAEDITWSTGAHGSTVTIDNPQTTTTYTASFDWNGDTFTQTFNLIVVYDEDLTGTHYLYNTATKRFLTAGNDYGTQATLRDTGADLTLAASGEGYTIDTRYNNGSTNQYLGADLYLDNASTVWYFTATNTYGSKNTYTLTTDGINYMTAPMAGDIVTTTTLPNAPRAQWVLYTRADLLAMMATASPVNPVNATFLLEGYDFSRNDLRNSSWEGSPAINGDNANKNGEKFNCNFDVYQALAEIPNGVYEVTLQGFYRNGGYAEAASRRTSGTEALNAYLYANEETLALPSIFIEANAIGNVGANSALGYIPNSQSDASKYLNAGLYQTEPLRVNVTDGNLRIGIKKTTAVTNDWTLFDNLRIVYWGAYLTDEERYWAALATAKSARDGNEEVSTGVYQGAATAAVAQYEWAAGEYAVKTNEQRETAIAVLNNGTFISNAGQSATSRVCNATFPSIRTISPAGWTLTKSVSGDTDIWSENGVFNGWAVTINQMQLSQTITNLPNGTYRVTAEVGTDNTDGSSTVAVYAMAEGGETGRSEEVITLNTNNVRNFAPYTCSVEVTDNQLTFGIRSNKHFYQVRNFTLEYIADAHVAAREADASYLRQDYFQNGRNTLEYDATDNKFTNASAVVIYPQKANQLIKARSTTQFAHPQNIVVNGVCQNFVISDGATSYYDLNITTGFTARNITYERPNSYRWGTLILPFIISADRDDVTFYKLKTVNLGADAYMTFTAVDGDIEANTPLVYRVGSPGESLTIQRTSENVYVSTTDNQNDITEASDWEMTGNYMAMTKEKNNGYYYIANDKFWLASTKDVNVGPFRAYFHNSDIEVKSLRLFIDSPTDGIEHEELRDGENEEMSEGDVYDLSGRKLSSHHSAHTSSTSELAKPITHLPKGLYIVRSSTRNGRKVVIK